MGVGLISAREAVRRLREPGVSVVHAGCGAADDHGTAHLPGAVYLDTMVLEQPPSWRLCEPGALAAAVSGLGIGAGTFALVYGRDQALHAPERGAGILASSRVALALTWLGVREVRVLDGGYDAWVRAGGDVDAGGVVAEAAGLLADVPRRPRHVVDAHGVAAAVEAGGVVADVRTWAEHVGAATGYPFVERAGRIPGSVWAGGGDHAHDMRHFRTKDGTMRPLGEIAERWAGSGVVPGPPVVFYCGTGWRAAEAWLAACAMGWKDVSVYDGGWLDWSGDPARPVASGIAAGG